ncbi:MAG: AAA family ATPase [Gracilibacteraceae bacterium]|jgi:chromosomal replication initiation ATPase DnaA|nr:AAA family ATPase [Gracilibacteraceae bacterium]
MYVSNCNGLCFSVFNDYDPATAPDILLLLGCPGSGKTLLLEHLRRKLQRTHRVSFLDSAAFARKFAFLLHKGDYSAWRKELRASEVLLVDDIHAIGGKKKTLEEMYYTMKDVLARGGKLVLTACGHRYCPEALGAHLRANLTTALTFRLNDPSLEEKEQFLRHYSRRRGIATDGMAALPLSDMSFKDIAAAVDGHAAGEPFVLRDLALAYERLLSSLRDVRHDDIVGRSKKTEIVQARREICFRLTENLGYSHRDVAVFLGHTISCIRQRCHAYRVEAGKGD